MKVVSFINQKGGTGKTTGAREVAGMLALNFNKKILLIDCDYQQNLTQSFIFDDEEKDLFKALKEKSLANNIIQIHELKIVENKDTGINGVEKGRYILDFIKGSYDLRNLDLTMDKWDQEMIYFNLKSELEKLDYDYVIFDCRPSIDSLERAVLSLSNYVLTPIIPHIYSVQGLNIMLQFIEALKENLSTPFIHLGYFNQVPLDKDILKDIEEIREGYPNILKTQIRDNGKLKYCARDGYFIGQYSPTSNGAKDFKNLTKELLEIWENQQ